MAVKFDDLENAFIFVSTGQRSMNSAYLYRETGQIFYASEKGDFDELPEDIYENDQYIEIPHKNDLDLGKALMFDFFSTYLPADLEQVESIFRKKGAYLKFKNLLERKGLLNLWYSYEDEHHKKALHDWCRENDIEIVV